MSMESYDRGYGSGLATGINIGGLVIIIAALICINTFIGAHFRDVGACEFQGGKMHESICLKDGKSVPYGKGDGK